MTCDYSIHYYSQQIFTLDTVLYPQREVVKKEDVVKDEYDMSDEDESRKTPEKQQPQFEEFDFDSQPGAPVKR